ncbi:MAG: hypothetical protein U1F43_20060 [Myxococcota bacterium]
MTWAPVAAVAVSAGCGGEDKGGSDLLLDVAFPDAPDGADTTTSSYAFVELCDGYADACCKLERCFFPDNLVSDEACKQAVRRVCEDTVTAPIGTYIDPGTVHYSPSAVGACYAPYLAATCDELGDVTGNPPLECKSAFEGTVDEGGACAFDDICKPDLFCKPAADGTCPGTCAPRKGLGETCNDNDAICQKDLICTGFGATDGVCAARHVGSGEACVAFDQCPEGHFCPVTTTKVCTPFLAEHAACSSFGCAPGLYCTDAGSTCEKVPEKGQACEYTCARPAVCIDGTCVDQPKAGDSCDNEFSSCGTFTASLQCDPGTKTCVPYIATGEPCGGANKPSRCADGYCDGALGEAGTCRPFKNFGDACSGFSECGRLSCLDDGHCGVDQNPCRGPGPLNGW